MYNRSSFATVVLRMDDLDESSSLNLTNEAT